MDSVAPQRLKGKWLGHWAGCWEKGEVQMIHSSKDSGEPGMRRFMSCCVWYKVGNVFPLFGRLAEGKMTPRTLGAFFFSALVSRGAIRSVLWPSCGWRHIANSDQ